MQIKTGLALAAGIGIGIFAGMNITDDTKEKCVCLVKKKIIFALTGEEWLSKKVSYAHYSRRYDKMPSEKKDIPNGWDTIAGEILQFGEDEKEAQDWLGMWINYAKKNQSHGTISIYDLVVSRDSHCDYTWDRYGWTAEEFLQNASVESNIYFNNKPQHEVKIGMRPHPLD